MTLKHYDIEGFETAVEEDMDSHIYTIKLKKLINGETVSAMEAIKATSKATYELTLPIDGVQSNPPIAGTFSIKCPGSDGNDYVTSDISVLATAK